MPTLLVSAGRSACTMRVQCAGYLPLHLCAQQDSEGRTFRRFYEAPCCWN